MSKFQKFVSENPDRVDSHTWWGMQEARTFGYVNGKFFISKDATNHPDFFIHLMNSKQVTKADFPPDKLPTHAHRDNFKFPGRLWIHEKIISFWVFPDKSEFNKLIDDLKKHGIDVNKDWRIDVNKTLNYGKAKLVPISEYTDKFKAIKVQQVDHVMDPIAKNIIKKATGIGSSTTKEINLPKGMSFAEYRHLTMKSESTSTVAPTSVATGQKAEKIGEPAKREHDKETIKKKIKKKLEESLKDQKARLANLTHSSHDVYVNPRGDKFRWDGNHFEYIGKENKVTGKNKSKVPGLEFQVSKVGGSRYMKVIHIKSGKSVLEFNSKPISGKLTDFYDVLNADLAAFDWIGDEKSLQPNLEKIHDAITKIKRKLNY